MSNLIPPAWAAAYPKEKVPALRYRPLLSAEQVVATKYVFEDKLVADTADNIATTLIELASINMDGIRDGHDHLSLDRIEPGRVRLRPLSYAYHTEFYRALDVTTNVANRPAKTLRTHLAQGGVVPPPNSDIAPCKLGISCLIIEKHDKDNYRGLRTRRPANAAWYPNATHNSFSGGVELRDLDESSGSLCQIIQKAAARECKEELRLDFPIEKISVLGIWRDMERCSAQAFGYVLVDKIADLFIQKTEEVKEHWTSRFGHRGIMDRLFRRIHSPELQFLEAEVQRSAP